MNKEKGKTSFDIIFLSVSILFITCVIVFFDTSLEKAKEIIRICIYSIIPSLFPFLVISKMLLDSGIIQKVSKFIGIPVKYVLKLPKQAVFPIIMGLISGFPVGAKVVVDMFKKNIFTKKQAEIILAISNNAGPIFVIGTVGVAFFGSKKIGIMLWGIQTMSALITMLIFCNLSARYNKNQSNDSNTYLTSKRKDKSMLLPDSIESSIQSILIVCGYVLFFSYVSSIIISSPINQNIISIISKKISISENFLIAFLNGFLELTQGCFNASLLNSNIAIRIILVSVFLSWSGISVHLQIRGIAAGTGLNLKSYFRARCLQMIISLILCIVNINKFKGIQIELISTNNNNSLFSYFTFIIAIGILLLSIYKTKKVN